MLLIYVLCDTLQFYYVYYAFGKLYFVLCLDRNMKELAPGHWDK